MAVSLEHDVLLQSSTRRPLGVEDFVHLLQSAAASLDTEDKPAKGVNEIEADEDEIVAPIDGLEGDGGDVGVVEVGAVGKDDVLRERDVRSAKSTAKKTA